MASTDSAMPAQHTSIQLRCSSGVASSRWAMRRAHSATVIIAERLMSTELTWLQMVQYSEDASTSAA